MNKTVRAGCQCLLPTATLELMKYYVIAGEASGDLHASHLIESLRKTDGNAQVRCFGGDLMEKAGATLVRHYRDLAYMGIWPVLTHLGTILKGATQCFSDIAEWKPDAVILVDYPGFNLKIASKVHSELGIPVYYYISPKIWAWKSYRIKNIRRYVSALFSILPFEVDYFARHDYAINYVGNPTVDEVCQYRRETVGAAPAIAHDGRRVVALLAGSRRHEITRNLPHMVEALKGIEGIRPVLACAPGIAPSFYDTLECCRGLEKVYGNTYGLLNCSYAALVTSGTATLETALFGVPQVVCYRMPARHIVSLFRGKFLKVKYISLVNLVTNSNTVPELVGADMTARKVREHLLPLLSESETRRKQLEGYERMRELLGPEGAPQKAAGLMADMLRKGRK